MVGDAKKYTAKWAMRAERQQTLGKGDKKAASQRVIEKEEITSTDLPKFYLLIYLFRV